MKCNTFGFALLFLCVCTSNVALGRSTPESPDFEAVVVEYAAEGHPATDPPLEVIRRNWAAYQHFIADAEGADMIVFPECGLTTAALPARRDHLRPYLSRVPSAATPTPLCDQQPFDGASEVLRNASCAARRHAIYVVLNLPEEFPCDSSPSTPVCPSDGFFIYNTNVVFDRNGSLVARYRKFHLFVEPGFDAPPRAELAVFETDFGVRFATFICFDVLFEAPALRVVQERGVTAVAYSTAWFSQLPFLTAVQTQAGWAHATNVTLLAAGLNRPEEGNTGSAIVWGDGGALSGVMRTHRGSVALRTRVPKRLHRPLHQPQPQHHDDAASPSTRATQQHNLTLEPLQQQQQQHIASRVGHLKLWQDDVRAWATVLLPPAGGAFNATLCPGATLCCRVETQSLNVAANASLKHYVYRAGAFDGVHRYGHVVSAGVQACAVFACADATRLDSCGVADDERVAGLAFQRLALTAHGFQRHHALQMPTTVEAETLLPLPASSFHFRVEASPEAATNRVVLTATQPLDASLLAVGVYGRVFDRDRPLADASSTTTTVHLTPSPPGADNAKDKTEL